MIPVFVEIDDASSTILVSSSFTFCKSRVTPDYESTSCRVSDSVAANAHGKILPRRERIYLYSESIPFDSVSWSLYLVNLSK
jgi:hypothetical protein